MHMRYTTAHKNHAKPQRCAQGALDKALDIWYNTGVGLKKNTNRSNE